MNQNNFKNSTFQEETKIFVCYNKPWGFPKNPIYVPIQSGKALSSLDLGILGDNTGDNISLKNETFGELTAWYWVWKNINSLFPKGLKYIGLSHYRRFFSLYLNEPDVIQSDIIPPMRGYEKKIPHILKRYQIILAKPCILDDSVYEQYAEVHSIQDYYVVKNTVHLLFPEYDDSFIEVMENNNKISCYCMFVSTLNFFNEYFEWLFSILFEMEKNIDISHHNHYQKRVFAFLAERLLNVYVYHKKINVSYKSIYLLNNYLSGINQIKYIKIWINSNKIWINNKLRPIYKRIIPIKIRKIIRKIRGKE
jgi:hypothetical protein